MQRSVVYPLHVDGVAPRQSLIFRLARHTAWRCAAVSALLLCCFVPAMAQAGLWCRGQLHAHSTHSDGDTPVAEVIAGAERLGFDFFALTDHDSSQGGNPAHWSDPAYASGKMVLLYGMEWTTSKGHANVWAAAPFDYRRLWAANTNLDPAAAARAMHDQGGLFSLNHPSEILGHPWQYPLPAEADCIEVWNSMFILQSGSFMTVNRLWDGLLRQGRRITAVGGSDKAAYTGWWSFFYPLDMPTTWVWAEERSAGAILAGIKHGHVSISYSADSPRLELAADADKDGEFETPMGDTVSTGQGDMLAMQLTVAAPDNHSMSRGSAQELALDSVPAPNSGGTIFEAGLQQAGFANAKNLPVFLALVYKNGIVCRAWLVLGDASISFRALAKAGDYFRAELKGLPRTPVPLRMLYGYTVAITNPVYAGAAGQQQ